MFVRHSCRIALALTLTSFVFAAARAQDTRTVTEPVIPPSCTVLAAQLASTDGIFSDTDEAKLDTARIQAAMDKCPKGHAVELKADGNNNAFLSGPLQLRAGVILLVDKGVTLYASRNPRDFDTAPNGCGSMTYKKMGCYPLIRAEDTDDTGVMGDGVIDGRGGAKILGQTMNWWELARETVKVNKGAHQQAPRLITTNNANNFTLYRITLRNSPNFHFVPHGSNGITVWGLKIDTPWGTPNTDGFDPSSSTNITITHSFIRDGDDNIAIKASQKPTTNMSVIDDHFYWGHGMSIGSNTDGGVDHVLVRDLSIDGATSGIRIKSSPTRGGLVKDIQYDNVCIRGSGYPITLTTNYSWPGGHAGLLPVYQDIYLHNVRLLGGGHVRIDGLDATHRIGIQFDGVMALDVPSLYKVEVSHTDLTLGPGPVNLKLAGEDSTVRGKPGTGTLPGCKDMFVAFPVTP